MDNKPTYNPEETPWHLIAASLQGELEPEEQTQLEQWLSQSPAHPEKYAQWQEHWRQGLTDYSFYRQADVPANWAALQQSIAREERRREEGKREEKREQAKIVRPAFRVNARQWMTAAAVIVTIAGAGWWFFYRSATTLYETVANEEKLVTLSDGSTIALHPLSAVAVPRDYDRKSRTVTLTKGAATFDVLHQAGLPFTVEMGTASVKDIGTRFTIQRQTDTINVTVHTGRIAFIKNRTGEQRELSGGMAMAFQTAEQSFGKPSFILPPAHDSTFQDMPLGEILTAMEKMYGKIIRLQDPNMATTKLTIRLPQDSFDDALKTLSISMNLKVIRKEGIYILKK